MGRSDPSPLICYNTLKRPHPMRYPIDTLTSNAIDTLSVNPITGTVRVRFLRYPTKRPYTLKASRRAILSLIWNSDQSVGQWVNRHCLAKTVTLDPLY